MAKIIENRQKHLVIQISKKEAVGLGYETVAIDKGYLICAVCGQVIDLDDIYYVASINDILCKECLEEFLEKAEYKTDRLSILKEREYYNSMMKKLNVL